jgi:predicted nucleic acid-binding protein
MNGNKLLLDTNIVLSLLSGDTTLSDFLYDKELYISFITEMELLSYKQITIKEKKAIKQFIKELTIFNINDTIKAKAITLRKISSIKLPDAIIAATSLWLNIPLFTADKQLSKVKGVNMIYYQNV